MKKSENKAPNKQFKLSGFLGRATLVIALVFLVTYMLTVVTGSTEFFTGSAEGNALVGFAEDLHKTEELTRKHYNALYEISEELAGKEDSEAVAAVLKEYIGSSDFGYIYYRTSDAIINADSTVLSEAHSGYAQLSQLFERNEQGCSELYRDVSGYDCIAFYVPVRGSSYVDGIASVLPARELYELDETLGDHTAVALLIDRSGRIMASAKSSLFNSQIYSDLLEFVMSLANDNEQITALNEAIATAQSSVALPLTAENARYTVAFSPLSTLNSRYLLLTLTDSDTLITEETTYIRHIITLVVIALFSLAVGAAYAIAYYRKLQAALDAATYVDPVVGCPNVKQFKDVAGKMLLERDRQFAVCVFELRGFRTISDEIGTNEGVELLKHIAASLEVYCTPRECFAYLGDGRFLQLLVFENESSIKDRVRSVETMTAKHSALLDSGVKKPFNIGVAITTAGGRRSIEEFMEHAAVACDNAANHISTSFEIYSAEVSAERERNRHIAEEMEAALENGAFRLFFQPKYNIAGDCIDSAEGLVRWFDPRTGDYRFPGEFLGLFETNGFITKLDKFMYVELLKLISNAVKRGEKVVPVSLNVSAVTFNTNEFLDFYIGNKKAYGVPDNMVMIEFPEAAASDDYARFAKIVDKLHRNGIRCSVDDFGNGSGSLGILKNIPLDEVKLSRLFMRSGVSAESDEVLLKTMVGLAKALGMKVVQEGVETKEMYERAAQYGCDAIQGYYYAKAISSEEYKFFVTSNTSIKYKSLVK